MKVKIPVKKVVFVEVEIKINKDPYKSESWNTAYNKVLDSLNKNTFDEDFNYPFLGRVIKMEIDSGEHLSHCEREYSRGLGKWKGKSNGSNTNINHAPK